jgi:hypothetical protein
MNITHTGQTGEERTCWGGGGDWDVSADEYDDQSMYWLLQRRLLAHAERCSRWMGASRIRVEARGHIGYSPDRAVEASGRRSPFDRAVSEAERGSCEPAAMGTFVRREGDRPSRGNIEGMCRPFPFEPSMPLMIAARSGLPDLYRVNLALQPSRPS